MVAAVSGLKAVGVVSATIIGLVDRDYYSSEVLNAIADGIIVLSVHEVESIICDQDVVAAVAKHFGKDPQSIWQLFLERVRMEFQGQTLNHVIANRVRARAGDLLDGAFKGAQIVDDLVQTVERHRISLSTLDLPAKTEAMFKEESKRVSDALASGGVDMLAILPGKHLLSILAKELGLGSTSELTSLVIRALNRQLKADDPLVALGAKIESRRS